MSGVVGAITGRSVCGHVLLLHSLYWEEREEEGAAHRTRVAALYPRRDAALNGLQAFVLFLAWLVAPLDRSGTGDGRRLDSTGLGLGQRG